MSALPGTPAIQNAIPMPFFGTTPFAAPGLGVIAAAIMLGFGLWWLRRAEAAARRSGEGYDDAGEAVDAAAADAEGVAIVRLAEVNAAELVWPAGITGPEQTTELGELAALNIIAR